MKHKQISLKLLCSYLFTRLGAQHVSLQTVGSYRLPVYLQRSSLLRWRQCPKFVVQQGLLLLVLLLYHWSAMEKSKVITNKVKLVFDVFSRFSCHSFGLSTNQLLTDIELNYSSVTLCPTLVRWSGYCVCGVPITCVTNRVVFRVPSGRQTMQHQSS